MNSFDVLKLKNKGETIFKNRWFDVIDQESKTYSLEGDYLVGQLIKYILLFYFYFSVAME